jgi:hypothetical protein
MSTNQRRFNDAGVILLAVGIPCLLLSLIMLSQRQTVAALLFGAHFFFGIPVTASDSMALVFATIGGVAGMLMSLALVVTGVIYAARGPKPQSGPGGTEAIPTPR